MLRAVQKRLLLILTMNIDHDIRNAAYHGKRHTLPIDPVHTASCHDLARDQYLIILHGDPHLLHKRTLTFGVCPEGQLYKSIIRPLSYHVLRTFLSKSQIDRTDDDRLTCTRLTGQYIKAIGEVNLHLVNDRQILHM